MPKNPLGAIESGLGAEFTDRHGFAIPAHYGDAKREHAIARTKAAVIDRAEVGRIKVTGRDRVDLLHRLSTQNLKDKVAPGRGAWTVFTTNKGRIVDHAGIFDRGDSLLLLTSAARRESLPAWIRKYVLTDQVTLTDITSEGGAFRVTGPLAADVMKSLGDFPLAAIEPGGIIGVPLHGLETTIIGERAGERPSYLLIAEAPSVAELFDAAAAVARTLGGGAAGEIARNVLRIEDGLPEADFELTEDYNPWEARLDDAISLTKGCYIGQEVVARLNTYDKVSKRLAGWKLAEGEAIELDPSALAGAAIRFEGHDAGLVTSAARSFVTGGIIGLAYLRMSCSEPGTKIEIAQGEAGGPGAPLAAVATSLTVVNG
jgi:folate-binding protein YgfZ